ncbi:indolepyruvate oxidoreductase subunit beta family protein [Nocardioides sp. AN3]
MTSWSSGRRPFTIAILAMGGEGGGVLADWIVAAGERAGHVAQSTSVAGVAQRTGATVYYVELFASEQSTTGDETRSAPVLSLFPTPGEVDIVIASELMEAGRAVQRGFSTPDRTTLIASTNRVYAMDERLALGDGRVDAGQLLEAARVGSRRLITADFMKLAEDAGSVISAALLGALAGSGALPLTRDHFEQAIREAGKGVDASLIAFSSGYDKARAPSPQPPTDASHPVPVTISRRRPVDPAEQAAEQTEQTREAVAATEPERLVGPRLKRHAARVASEFPLAARSMLLHGCVRTAVFQDERYTDRYLSRVARFAAHEIRPHAGAPLTLESARHIALWMCYQDTIQVAHQKIRRRRLEAVRDEARAAPGQLLNVREYLHPQVQEITDTLPAPLGRLLARSAVFHRIVGRVTRRGMVVNTTGILGFTSLWVTARVRPLRAMSLRFGREQDAIDRWLDRAESVAATDYDLACEIIRCQSVLKGYGATWEHGQASFDVLMQAAERLRGHPEGATIVAKLRSAALADDSGVALDREWAVYCTEMAAD